MKRDAAKKSEPAAGLPRHAQHGSESPLKIRVSIVEDDSRVRGGLVQLINLSEGFQCVSFHSSAEAAFKDLAAAKPDVVLMDINLPGVNGVECVRQLKPSLPKTQIMMLTVYEETEMIFKALTAGATGYLLKQTPPAELLQAIRDVHRGGSPMTSHIARKIVASFQQPVVQAKGMENLTPREQEVLDHLAKGFLYKEIADALGISYDTVHAHIRRIYEKLQVRSRTEAVAKRLHQGGHVPRSPVGAA
jgi:DNA-binding NarL/FixJ family response regulator